MKTFGNAAVFLIHFSLALNQNKTNSAESFSVFNFAYKIKWKIEISSKMLHELLFALNGHHGMIFISQGGRFKVRIVLLSY